MIWKGPHLSLMYCAPKVNFLLGKNHKISWNIYNSNIAFEADYGNLFALFSSV